LLATYNADKLISYGVAAAKSLFQKGTNYKKAGIIAHDLKPACQLQTNLFVSENHTLRSAQLMQAMDAINKRMGKNTIHFAACGTNQNWKLKAEHKSPKYTTNWEELLRIKT